MATKFYLHRGTANPPGTMPSASALGGTPTVTASGAATLRWMDSTVSGVSQTSAATNTDGTSNAQTAWHTRHVSARLAAQTISAQTITYSLAASEGNANSNFNPSIHVVLWRPSTGSAVGTIIALGTITVTEPSTSQTAVSGTGTSTSQTAQADDVLIIETWRKSVAPSATAARANTTFYDGTTEASTTNVASFVNFANTLTYQALNPQPTAASLTATGATPTVTAPDAKVSVPTAASLTATGATPTVATTANVTTSPTAAGLTAAGATPTVTAPALSQPAAATLTAAGATPTVTAPALSLPSVAALVATAATPIVFVTDPKTAQPDAAALALSGATPTVTAPAISQPTSVALITAGATPDVLTPVLVVSDALALVTSMATPTLALVIATTAADLVLTGAIPVMGGSVSVLPDPAALTATGATPTIAATAHLRVLPEPAAMIAAGSPPTVVATANVTASPTATTLHLTGSHPTIAGVTAPVASTGRMWYPVYIRRPPTLAPVTLEPAAASLGIAGAAPVIDILDDGDFMALLDSLG